MGLTRTRDAQWVTSLSPGHILEWCYDSYIIQRSMHHLFAFNAQPIVVSLLLARTHTQRSMATTTSNVREYHAAAGSGRACVPEFLEYLPSRYCLITDAALVPAC